MPSPSLDRWKNYLPRPVSSWVVPTILWNGLEQVKKIPDRNGRPSRHGHSIPALLCFRFATGSGEVRPQPWFPLLLGGGAPGGAPGGSLRGRGSRGVPRPAPARPGPAPPRSRPGRRAQEVLGPAARGAVLRTLRAR